MRVCLVIDSSTLTVPAEYQFDGGIGDASSRFGIRAMKIATAIMQIPATIAPGVNGPSSTVVMR